MADRNHCPPEMQTGGGGGGGGGGSGLHYSLKI